jgi:hypothetical protein
MNILKGLKNVVASVELDSNPRTLIKVEKTVYRLIFLIMQTAINLNPKFQNHPFGPTL